MAKPYEPPPDYPMIDEEWENRNRIRYLEDFSRAKHLPQRFVSSVIFDPAVIDKKAYRYSHYDNHIPPQVMLRTRQFPEVAGIFGCDDQPSLRRFVRFNDNSCLTLREVPSSPPIQQATTFSKSSRKPAFFTGNWTFREKKSSSRPTIDTKETFRRDDRPLSVNLSDMRGFRSRSETSGARVVRPDFLPPAHRPPTVDHRHTLSVTPPEPKHHHQHSSSERSSTSTASSSPSQDYTTRIVLEDSSPAILRQKPKEDSRRNYESHLYLRKSCPDLDSVGDINSFEEPRVVVKKRNRRAKEKALEAKWRTKYIQDWCLDDVLLWLQHLQLDEVASLLIGYDLRGEDLLQWNHQCLAQLGVSDVSSREKILRDLKDLQERGPEKVEKKLNRTLFDLVKQTSYDQVLAVETPLTPRDITVTHGRFGCLQVTKVNGSNLPLKEHDCLLEINERSGEQFKSALMLTKLITSSNGEPIRFVILRRKHNENSDDSSNETSSSGISSSPQSPID